MIKGKVIIAFLLACVALFLAWGISNGGFREMLKTVEQFSAPNEKLSVVNNLYRRITRLEQLQRSSPSRTTSETQALVKKESQQLMELLDRLAQLYQGERLQSNRIQAMKLLLEKRERLFSDYLVVREAIVSNKMLDGEVRNLNELLLDKARLPDSTTILKAENKSTTTIIPARKQETQVGLLRRIFGKRPEERKDTTPEKIINEELSITIDTLASHTKDSLFKSVDSVLVNLQKKQKQQSGQFIAREKQLNDAGNILVSQILTLLEQVENEVVKQSRANHAQAAQLVADSSREIKAVILAFFFLTTLLVYVILADISRNNSYRQMLELANQEAVYHTQAKQRFLSNMSHEIRTPLQAIMGYAELARQGYKPEQSTIEAIYSSSTHLLQIVNEVLDYSSLVSGKFHLNKAIFRLADLFDEVIGVMSVQAEKKSLVLATNYEFEQNLHLEGDPFRLKQIIYNLLGNAIKFTETGTVAISLSGKENNGKLHLTIQVEDSGIGIRPEDTARIFGDFERTENMLKNNNSGTGLGLSIVNALVLNQGGRIYVKSELSAGSCFTVYLPFAIVKEPALAPATERQHARKPYMGRVWMVDDDNFILQLCASIFKKNHIDYQCFDKPNDLLLQSPPIDLSCVLVDMRMPGLSGAELCTILRKKLTPGMHIFALTAQALPWETESIMKLGFDGLLIKPFKEEELVDLIYSTLPQEADRVFEQKSGLRSVAAMGIDDTVGMISIVKQFVQDTQSDIESVKESISEKDVDSCLLLLHRIAGRTAQFGSTDLAADFRVAELRLTDDHHISLEFEMQVQLLLQRLAHLLRTMESNLYTPEVYENIT